MLGRIGDETMKLASMNADGWELVDGEEQNRQSPDSFHIPPIEARQGLKAGQHAKLTFIMLPASDRPKASAGRADLDDLVKAQNRLGRARERMWVLVTLTGANQFVGTLDNKPNNSSALERGARIVFEARHVVDILG